MPREPARGSQFFSNLDRLVAANPVQLDRPRGSMHPRVPGAVYPVDYGHLEGTVGGDGEGVDVFIGEAGYRRAVAVFLTADLVKRDVEVKVLLGCTPEETESVRRLLEDVLGIGGLLVARPI